MGETTQPGDGLVPTPGPVPEPIPPKSTIIQAATPGQDVNWERQFNALRGTMIADRANWDTAKGQNDAITTQLREQVQQLQGSISSLTTERDSLQATTEGLPELRETAGRVPDLLEQHRKLQAVLHYPGIVGQAQEVEIEAEDGTKTKQKKNALLDMILTSRLDGENWDRMLHDVAEALPGLGEAPPAAQPLQGVTTPPQPVTKPSMDELITQRNNAMLEGNYIRASELNAEIANLS